MILLVPGAALSTIGIALVAYGVRNGDAFYTTGSIGFASIAAALPAVAIGSTLLVVGKKKRARAVAASAQGPLSVSFGPSFTLHRLGAQFNVRY